MIRGPGRWVVVAGLAAALALASPAPAAAHAALVTSNPEPGERLTTAPGFVMLEFGEPLVPGLSEVTVTAPDGRRVSARPSDGDPNRIRVPLQTSARGEYEVRWRTVSPFDGHTLTGGFRFGVGVDVEPAVTGTGGDPQQSELALAIVRFGEDAALLLLLGGLALTWLGRRSPVLTWVPAPSWRVAAAAVLAGVMVVAWEAADAVGSLSPGGVWAYLSSGRGGFRAARLVAETLGLVSLAAGWRRLAAAATGAALVALAASGHAGAAHPPWWGTAAQAVHLWAAGIWVGGILHLATIHPPEGWRGDPGRDLLGRFTPVALVAFAATVGFGSVRALQELGRIGDLWSTAYGAALAVKLTLVAAMVPLSLRAWQARRPMLRREAAVGALATAVAALLAAFPLPPQRAAEAEAASAAAALSSAVPRPGDLTLGAAAGETVVGVTVRPGTPGPNDLYLIIDRPPGRDPAERVRLRVGRVHEGLEACGTDCRRARTELQGGETVEVVVDGEGGGTAVVVLPPLPVPSGEELLGRVDERMARLRSYRVAESLGPADPPIESSYEFAAPDRMHFRVLSNGQETVRIGDRRYLRLSPDERWDVRTAPPIDTSEFIWDQARRRGVRVIGTESVEGVETEVVAFFALTAGGTRLWYRLWIGADGLVRRARMVASGHLMDHRYFGFDEPTSIEAPEVGEAPAGTRGRTTTRS